MNLSILGKVLGVCCPVVGWACMAKDAYDVCTKPRRGPVQMFCMDHVKPIRGSIVCCDLAGHFEHSGVYVGGGLIVHRDGDGYLAKVDMHEFLGRLGGYNPAVTVFVSCRDGNPVGGRVIANRALAALANPSMAHGYDLLTKNCHQFSQYCVSGSIDNGLADFSFSNLEDVLKRELGMNSWRVWDGCWENK